MASIQIPDFCGTLARVTLIDFAGGKLVGICQRAGSCSFQHAMTPDQADAMADALRAKAAEARGQSSEVLISADEKQAIFDGVGA